MRFLQQRQYQEILKMLYLAIIICSILLLQNEKRRSATYYTEIKSIAKLNFEFFQKNSQELSEKYLRELHKKSIIKPGNPDIKDYVKEYVRVTKLSRNYTSTFEMFPSIVQHIWKNISNDTISTQLFNAANEIVTLDNSTTSITTDLSGNLTRIPNPLVATSTSSSLPAASSFFHSPRRFAAPRQTVSAEPKNLNLTYDAWNRLVRVTAHDGTPIATYTYDGLNRRILKTTPSETRRYYYNHKWQCLLETADNQPSIHYTWGLRYLDDLVCRHIDHHPTYSLADPNWNVVALTDSTATPLERYTYTAFGKLNIYDSNFTKRNTSNYNWTHTFTSQLLAPETGLLLYRNRFYHPTLGRFLTRDPVSYYGDFENLYRYVHNNPIYLRDSLGFAWENLGPAFNIPPGYIPPEIAKVQQPDIQPMKICQIYPSSPNGCGAKDSRIPIPDDFGLWDFRSSCNAHDICYGTCGTDKTQCDNEFRKNLLQQCEAYHYWDSPLVPFYQLCRSAANTYYIAVAQFGQSAFDKAQNENCVTIPEDECCPPMKERVFTY